MMRLAIPDRCLVVLMGATGSGKTEFAARHFAPSEVVHAAELDSDAIEAQVAECLDAGGLCVLDRPHLTREERVASVRMARHAHVVPVAVVLDVPFGSGAAVDGPGPSHRAQRAMVRQSLPRLVQEGFHQVTRLEHRAQLAQVEVARTPLPHDRRALRGPFDIIGDVHGCRSELESLLHRLGYTRAATGEYAHPSRVAVFVGDLVDRGPDSPGVLDIVMDMVARGAALCVAGNHDAKLVRKLSGRDVRVSHGMAQTLAQLDKRPSAYRDAVRTFLGGLPLHLLLDGGELVVAHAGLIEALHGGVSNRVQAFCLYGQTTGEIDAFGLPVRQPWADEYRGAATVVYGHTPTARPEWVHNTICVDTGCVFGGALSAMRYPERTLVSVPAARCYYASPRPIDGKA